MILCTGIHKLDIHDPQITQTHKPYVWKWSQYLIFSIYPTEGLPSIQCLGVGIHRSLWQKKKKKCMKELAGWKEDFKGIE